MLLFERLKHPEGPPLEAEGEQEVEETVSCHEEATLPSETGLSEVDELRSSARAIDDRRETYRLNERGEAFLRLCLAKAREASQSTQEPHNVLDVLRAVKVTVVSGDWATVLASRGQAIAVVAELRRLGFEVVKHEYHQVQLDDWELRIQLAF